VRLISKVLGFVLSKAFLVVAMMVVLFVGHLTINALQEAVENRDQLAKVVKDQQALQRDVHQLKAAQERAQEKSVENLADKTRSGVQEFEHDVAQQKSRVHDLEKIRDGACGFRGKVADALTPGSSCDAAKDAVRAAKRTLRTVQQSLDQVEHDARILSDPKLTNREKLEQLGETAGDRQLERQIKFKQARLDENRDKKQHLTEVQDSWAGQVVKQWDQSREGVLEEWSQAWKWLLVIVLTVLLAPAIWRTVGYWVVMPAVSQAHKPIQLADASEHTSATVHTSPAERTLPIRLSDGEVLSARSEHVRPVRGKARSQILYDWSAPFISFAAGLYGLSRITGDAEGTEATLATPDDPSSYLMRIDFKDHPGVVMHPRHVVGVIGAPELVTRWSWGIQSLATWQVRYIMFAGTGSLIVQGSGDVVAGSPGDRPTKMEQHLLMGFDARLTGRVNRTEVFWPYLWGKTPLVDDEFTGPYVFFWQKSSTEERSNPAVKAFNAIFSALGKLLGF
jgi:hypothetical protein